MCHRLLTKQSSSPFFQPATRQQSNQRYFTLLPPITMTQFFAAFEDLFKSIYELFASIIGTFAHAIQVVISTILNFFSGIINLFTDVFKGVVDVVGGVGSFVISKSSKTTSHIHSCISHLTGNHRQHRNHWCPCCRICNLHTPAAGQACHPYQEDQLDA